MCSTDFSDGKQSLISSLTSIPSREMRFTMSTRASMPFTLSTCRVIWHGDPHKCTILSLHHARRVLLLLAAATGDCKERTTPPQCLVELQHAYHHKRRRCVYNHNNHNNNHNKHNNNNNNSNNNNKTMFSNSSHAKWIKDWSSRGPPSTGVSNRAWSIKKNLQTVSTNHQPPTNIIAVTPGTTTTRTLCHLHTYTPVGHSRNNQ
jgi:hypothetical protein